MLFDAATAAAIANWIANETADPHVVDRIAGRVPLTPTVKTKPPGPSMWWECREGHRVLAHRPACHLCGRPRPA